MAGLADYVLVDLPAHASPASQAAIRCSRRIFLVVEPVRDCIEAGFTTAAYLKTQASAGTDVRVVIVPRAPLASPVAPGDIQTRLGCQVAAAIPPAADECSRAQQIGRPVLQSQPEAFVSQAFGELVRALG